MVELTLCLCCSTGWHRPHLRSGRHFRHDPLSWEAHRNRCASRGLVFSGAVLLALARHGQSRQDAYGLVQGHAMAVWDEGGHLYDRLADDERVTKLLDPDELAECFDLDRQLRNTDRIFERVLGAGA